MNGSNFIRLLYVVVILFFIGVNAMPYWARHQMISKLKVEVVTVTEENGRPVDIFTTTREITREIARRAADVFGFEHNKTDVGESFLVEVAIINGSKYDFSLLEGDYAVYLQDKEVATGSFHRRSPLEIESGGKGNLFLPVKLLERTNQFASMARANPKGKIKGDVGLVRDGRVLEFSFETIIDFTQVNK